MARNFNISAIFSGVDRLSPMCRRMAESVNQFSNSTRTASTTASASMGRVDNSVRRTEQQLRTLNHVRFSGLREGIHSITSALAKMGSTAAGVMKSLTPGMGTLATGLAAGYVGKQILDNSAGYETNEIKTMALLRSRPENKNLDLPEIKRKSLDMIASNQRFADTQVGETSDWNDWQANTLMTGLTPDDAMRKMAGTFGALHKNGMSGFNETFGSMLRGETTAADQIGQQMKSDKGVIAILDPKTEKFIELGAKGTMEFKTNLVKFLEKDAGERFSFVSPMMGEGFEARWATLTSAFKTGLDDMVRKTGWWDKTVKPAVDNVTASFKQLTPNLVNLSESVFQKFGKLSVFTGLSDNLGESIDNLAQSVSEVSDEDLKAIGDNIKQGVLAVGHFGSAVIDLLPKLTEVINFISNPYEAANNHAASLYADNMEKNGGQLTVGDKFLIAGRDAMGMMSSEEAGRRARKELDRRGEVREYALHSDSFRQDVRHSFRPDKSQEETAFESLKKQTNWGLEYAKSENTAAPLVTKLEQLNSPLVKGLTDINSTLLVAPKPQPINITTTNNITGTQVQSTTAVQSNGPTNVNIKSGESSRGKGLGATGKW